MIASTASTLSRVHNSGDSAQTHDRESRSKASPEVGGFDESPGSALRPSTISMVQPASRATKVPAHQSQGFGQSLSTKPMTIEEARPLAT